MREAARQRDAALSTVTLPASQGRTVPWPDWVPAAVSEAYRHRGVTLPWAHQERAASLLDGGRDVVMATGTGSGKSLGYQLPLLARLLSDPRATALYLAPTKALAHDQMRVLRELGMVGPSDACVVDGDTPADLRAWARSHARLVLTNPDMLHASLLPGHQRWARFLSRLTLVVVDECHHYRGVFGSHVALVLRRTLRLARALGAEPVFAHASATVADPGRTARELTGRTAAVVDADASPRPRMDLAVWIPAAGVSARAETAWLLARLVSLRARTLAFVRSRAGAEHVAREASATLARRSDPAARAIAPYRAGLLPEQRRSVEAALLSGTLLGVASTNALELGIDISGLDAVVMEGYPGSVTSLRQQMGRAGRGGHAGLAVMIAREDPLDRFLAADPQLLLGRPVEDVVTNRSNRYVLTPHLLAAVAERPWTEPDHGSLGSEEAELGSLEDLADRRLVRRRPAGWYRTPRPVSPVGLRAADGLEVAIVEAASGQVLGTVGRHAAGRSAHPGAVFLQGGVTLIVEDLDLDAGVALVRREDPGWTTQPRITSHVELGATQRTQLPQSSDQPSDRAPHEASRAMHAAPEGVRLGYGPVTVRSQVVGFLRRSSKDGSVIDEQPLTMPEQLFATTAVWWALADVGSWAQTVDPSQLPGALHAAEHASIGILPLLASCDRRDIGGLSTALHEQTGLPTVFVYDGVPGGVGIAERGFETAVRWLSMTRDVIAACPCSDGCPGCVQSPKCGNGNSPLSKPGAVAVLSGVITSLGRP